MVAVDPKRRSLGADKAMVDLVINTREELVPKTKIVVRCLPIKFDSDHYSKRFLTQFSLSA